MRKVFAIFALLGFAACGYSQACSDYACDTTRVRTILDANGKYTTSAVSVTTKSGNRVTELRLQYGFNTVPGAVGDIAELKTLYIDGDPGLHSLPNEIGNLTKLETFYGDNNHLDSIPASINGCIKLKCLYLFRNNLQGKFPDISNLDSLVVLQLYNNNIQSLSPFGVGQTKIQDLRPSEQFCIRFNAFRKPFTGRAIAYTSTASFFNRFMFIKVISSIICIAFL